MIRQSSELMRRIAGSGSTIRDITSRLAASTTNANAFLTSCQNACGTLSGQGSQGAQFMQTQKSLFSVCAGQYDETPFIDARSEDGVIFRKPTTEDAKGMCDIVYSGTLDNNSAYAYIAFCKHFRDECIIAELNGEVIGFIKGYRPPREQYAIFVWQVGVGEKARGRGIGGRMIAQLAKRLSRDGVTHVQATVTPTNTASRNLFSGVGRRAGAEVTVTESWIKESHFPDGTEHEAEDHFHIGPFSFEDISEAVNQLEETAAKK